MSNWPVAPMSQLTIVGVPGSPYSRKLRAVLRYRRIPHAWVLPGSPESRGLPEPRVALVPRLIVPSDDGTLEARVDSTPLIRELETRYRDRSVIPSDPAMAFLDALLEDYADEWLTKPMFHYRWAFPADVARAAAILPRWLRPGMPEAQAIALGTEFAERQIARLAVVGSNETTAPVIEDSYRRLLALLDAHLTGLRFVMGSRPGAADFGLFTSYGLSAAVVGADVGRAKRIADQLHAGIVHINDQPVLHEVYGPIGGVGVSGNGHNYGAVTNADQFTEWQWVTTRTEMPPYPF